MTLQKNKLRTSFQKLFEEWYNTYNGADWFPRGFIAQKVIELMAESSVDIIEAIITSQDEAILSGDLVPGEVYDQLRGEADRLSRDLDEAFKKINSQSDNKPVVAKSMGFDNAKKTIETNNSGNKEK